jgi:hypothetical protein
VWFELVEKNDRFEVRHHIMGGNVFDEFLRKRGMNILRHHFGGLGQVGFSSANRQIPAVGMIV